MFLMYVDESGDPGAYQGKERNSRHYILSGIIVPIKEWQQTLDRFKSYRSNLKKNYGLNLREEIHASELIRISKVAAYRSIHKTQRLEILRETCLQIPQIFSSSKILNICLHKPDFKDDVNLQALGWSRIIQRYHTFMKKYSGDVKGIIVADGEEQAIVRKQLRKMRVYNPIPSKFGSGTFQDLTDTIIEDVFSRDSKHSYFIQAADVVAHCLYRKEYPKGSLKKYNVDKYFDLLEPILLKKAASKDPLGIVRT